MTCKISYNGNYRKIWKAANGEKPKGLQLNHKCGNRFCINLEHIYLGSQAENMRDRSIHHHHQEDKLGAFQQYVENPKELLDAIGELFPL